MKSANHRDQMVARVNDAVKRWPTFAAMPEVNDVLVARVDIKGYPRGVAQLNDVEQHNYISALYELCALGAVPIGRYKNSITIVGNGNWSEK